VIRPDLAATVSWRYRPTSKCKVKMSNEVKSYTS
jgi:hypothetical protein